MAHVLSDDDVTYTSFEGIEIFETFEEGLGHHRPVSLKSYHSLESDTTNAKAILKDPPSWISEDFQSIHPNNASNVLNCNTNPHPKEYLNQLSALNNYILNINTTDIFNQCTPNAQPFQKTPKLNQSHNITNKSNATNIRESKRTLLNREVNNNPVFYFGESSLANKRFKGVNHNNQAPLTTTNISQVDIDQIVQEMNENNENQGHHSNMNPNVDWNIVPQHGLPLLDFNINNDFYVDPTNVDSIDTSDFDLSSSSNCGSQNFNKLDVIQEHVPSNYIQPLQEHGLSEELETSRNHNIPPINAMPNTIFDFDLDFEDCLLDPLISDVASSSDALDNENDLVAYRKSFSKVVEHYESHSTEYANSNLNSYNQNLENIQLSLESVITHAHSCNNYIEDENQIANTYTLPLQVSDTRNNEKNNKNIELFIALSTQKSRKKYFPIELQLNTTTTTEDIFRMLKTFNLDTRGFEKDGISTSCDFLFKEKNVEDVTSNVGYESEWKKQAQDEMLMACQNTPQALDIQGIGASDDIVGNAMFAKSNNDDEWRKTSKREIQEKALTYVNGIIPQEWNKMPNPQLIGMCMSMFSKEQLTKAWDVIYNNEALKSSSLWSLPNVNTNVWNPIMYRDEKSRMYQKYFPVVMESKTLKILAFDYKNHAHVDDMIQDSKMEGWTIMPSLDWIKSKIATSIIAAKNGLVVCDSLKPPPSIIQINHKSVLYVGAKSESYQKKIVDKYQTLLTIINPLTHEYFFLPPIPFHVHRQKVGYLDFLPKYYQLFILGTSTVDALKAEGREHGSNERVVAQNQTKYVVSLAIYSSLHQLWIYFDSFENVRVHHFGGRGCFAVMNYGLYFGGIKMDPQLPTSITNQMASVFYINCSNNRRQFLSYPFLIQGIGDIQIPEPPKVIKVANNKIYAVTRETVKKLKNQTNCIMMVEIVLNDDGSPTGEYAPVINGVMPEKYTEKLFQIVPSVKGRAVYQVYSCGDLIAFKAEYPVFVLYDVNTSNWRLTNYETDVVAGIKRNYVIFEGMYQPDWLAGP